TPPGMIEFVPKRGLTRFSLILPIHPDGEHAPGRKPSLSPTEGGHEPGVIRPRWAYKRGFPAIKAFALERIRVF
ncbi:hypothetical protein, partial [Guyparkeria sp. SB14A]|uniref:hypothetical protein n=1 Tax=Guyparkeria sp. SB14A TaxID=2571147 RepID=UPI001B7FADC9